MATTTTKKKAATTEDMLAGMITDYQGRSAYTPKTAAEIQAQAQGEYQPYYDQLRLSAKQKQQQSDLALQQQRAGLQDTFNQQREASAKNYRQAYSQTDRQMLGRGMQRSSYNAQTLANINQQGAEAQQKLWDAQGAAEGNIDAQRAQLNQQLADQLNQYNANQAADVLSRTRQLQDQEYERQQAWQQRQDQLGLQLASALRQAERDQISDAQFEKQFGLSKQQAEATIANMQWQQRRTEAQDALAAEQWNKQFGLNERQLQANLENQAWQRERQEARDRISDEQFEKQFGLTKAQFDAQLANQQWQQQRTEAQDRLAAEQWAKQFGLSEQELAAQLANQEWQRAFNERQYQNTLENQLWQRDYQTNRDLVADQQWQANYDYNNRKLDETLAEQLYQRQYQENRDKVSDEQWQKEYDLKAKQLALSNAGTSATRASGGSSGGSSGGGGSVTPDSVYEEYVHELLKNRDSSTKGQTDKPASTADIIAQLSDSPDTAAKAGKTYTYTPQPVYSVTSLSPVTLTPGATTPKASTAKPGTTVELSGPVNAAFLAELNGLGAKNNIAFESQLANALKNKKK